MPPATINQSAFCPHEVDDLLREIERLRHAIRLQPRTLQDAVQTALVRSDRLLAAARGTMFEPRVRSGRALLECIRSRSGAA